MPTLVCGVMCMLLRLQILIYGYDEKGLMIPGNMMGYTAWMIAFLFMVGLALGVTRIRGNGTYNQLFPLSFFYGTLVILAGGILLLVSLMQTTTLELVMCICAGLCMIWTGISRVMGKRPPYGLNFVVCVFFAVKLVMNYRDWSTDPQLQDYAFQILACVMLMLAAFYRASADANIIHRKRMVFTCLGACFMCIVSLSDPDAPIYYGACALWALGNVGVLESIRTEMGD